MRSLILATLLLSQCLMAAAEPIAPGFVRPGSSDTDLRTWTSQEGREVMAELVEVQEDVVVLVTLERERLTVPIARLSEGDRQYIARWIEHRSLGIGFFEAGVFPGEGLPEKARIDGVEHVVQKENYCATASAEMILRFYGFDYDQKFLARISSEESRRGGGTSQRALLVALRNVGLDVAVLRPDDRHAEKTAFENLLNGIRHAIVENRPVALSYRVSSTSHMVVVVGYDDRRRSLYLLDPAGRGAPVRIRYKEYEDVVNAAMVPFPLPNALRDEPLPEPDLDFLRQISGIIRNADSLRPYGTALRLRKAGIEAEMRDVNRLDARSSQGLTRSFARQHGVTFVQQALDRGSIVLAPQSFETGNGLILIYGHVENKFQSVEYFADGTFRRGETSLLDFSLRWMEKKDDMHLLYIVEVTPPAA